MYWSPMTRQPRALSPNEVGRPLAGKKQKLGIIPSQSIPFSGRWSFKLDSLTAIDNLLDDEQMLKYFPPTPFAS